VPQQKTPLVPRAFGIRQSELKLMAELMYKNMLLFKSGVVPFYVPFAATEMMSKEMSNGVTTIFRNPIQMAPIGYVVANLRRKAFRRRSNYTKDKSK
jgi:hypothetical protein